MDLDRADLLDRPSDGARTAAVLLQLGQLAVAFAVLDRSGADAGRTAVLAAFAGVLWARNALRVFRVSRDSFGWWDASVASLASVAYLVGFAALGAHERAPLSIIDGIALALYAAGALLSTTADAVRSQHRAGDRSLNALCTTGPYALVRHPKYAGDLAWASGWALATHAPAAWIVVGVHAAILLLVYIPALERRLAGRYGAGYRSWAHRTARLIPFVF